MSQNNSIFIPKKAFESHLKAVLEGLNVKFFFVAQRWWVTLFRQIVSGNLTLIIITNLTGLLAANWLQKLETKHCHCVYYAGYLCSYVWVFVSVWQLKTMIIKKNFMTLFYGWGSTASRLQPLWGGSLPFTIQFPENPGTHFIDLGRIKGYRTSGLGIQCLNR